LYFCQQLHQLTLQIVGHLLQFQLLMEGLMVWHHRMFNLNPVILILGVGSLALYYPPKLEQRARRLLVLLMAEPL
jgi:hypothetical protein